MWETGISFAEYTFAGDADTGMFSPGPNLIAWKSGGVERARSTTDARYLLACTSDPSASVPGSRFGDMVNAGHIISSGAVANFGHFTFVNGNGPVGSIATSGSSTAYNTSSDGRLKSERAPLAASAIIDALQPLEFTWTHALGRPRGVGLIAQDVHAIVPGVVTAGDDNPDGAPSDEAFRSWEIDYSKLVPYLLAELKALRARVAQLENR